MESLKKRVHARGQGGFTLIELLVVIAILAILAGVVIFAVGNSTDNAKVSTCKTELASVKTAIAAAKTANEVNSTASQETPAAYLDTSASAPKYYTWAGSSPNFTVSAIGTPPC
jgi:general secretion pathway protein G